MTADNALINVSMRQKQWDSAFDASMLREDVERLLRVKPFQSMDADKFPSTKSLFDILLNETRLRQFNKGDVVCRQGDYGSSAFLLLGGQARSFYDLPPKLLGRGKDKKRSLFSVLSQIWRNSTLVEERDLALYGKAQDAAHAIAGSAGQIQDLDVLSDKYRHDKLAAGDVFAELTVMSRSAHQTTVVAAESCEMLEIKWQGFRELMKFAPDFKQAIETSYRERGLTSHLKSFSLLAGLSDPQINAIAAETHFESYGRFDWFASFKKAKQADQLNDEKLEPIIVNEGDYAEGLLLIRSGFVRVCRKQGDGWHTSHYLRKGDTYGLDVLQTNLSSNTALPYTDTLKAVGYADVLLLPTDLVKDIVVKANPSTDNSWLDKGTSEQGLKEFLIDQRFINGTQTMLINLDRCTGCDDCVSACSRAHDNNPRFIRHGEVHDKFMVANACMHCHDPVCLIGCPTGAIHRRSESGQVIINDQTCIGCMTCANSCPYSNIRMVNIRDEAGGLLLDEQHKPILKATKCDLCFDQQVAPACQKSCPHDALRRIDLRDMNKIKDWL